MFTLLELGQLRDTILGRVMQTLERDGRVNAAWLSGSYGRGEADAWSDLDLHMVVADEHLEAMVAAAESLFRCAGEPIAVYGGMRSNSMPGGYFWLVQYAPYMLEIDWNIGPTTGTTRPAASHLLLNRVEIPITPAQPPLDDDELRTMAARELAFFWAMAPLAVKFAGRGHTRLAVKQVDYLEGAYINLWRVLNHPAVLPRDSYHQNRPLEDALDATLPRFGPVIDPMAALSVICAFCTAMQELHPALASMGVTVDGRVVEEIAALAEIAEVEAQAGGSSPQRGSRR